MLDGSKGTFDATLETLELFSNLYGLNINYDMSEVMWIGSKTGCDTRCTLNLNINWNPPTFKILGSIFSTNVTDMVELNYKDKICEIKQLLNIWMKRSTTPLDKIAVIKALLIAKFNYLFLISAKSS